MKKILFITTSYLLNNSSAAIRNNSLVKGLVELGYEVDVYTVKWPDTLLSDYFSQNQYATSLYTTNLPNLDLIGGMKKNVKVNNIIVSSLKRFIKQILFFPDECGQWSRLFDYSNLPEFDYLITSSDLKSSHFVGLELKRKFPHIKWIQVWGDPWSSDINTLLFMKWITAYYEEKLLREADKIVYVSSATREQMAKKYRGLSSKMYYIPRGFLVQEDKKKPCSCNDCIHIVYTGLLIGGRNITPLLDVIAKEYNNLPYKVVIDIYGGFLDGLISILKKYPFVNLYGGRDYKEMIEVYKNASMLLYLSNKKGATQIPGKLYDYMGTTKPILCLVEDSTDTISEFLREHKRCLVINNDVISISNAFSEILVYSKLSFEISNEYSPINIARAYESLWKQE